MYISIKTLAETYEYHGSSYFMGDFIPYQRSSNLTTIVPISDYDLHIRYGKQPGEIYPHLLFSTVSTENLKLSYRTPAGFDVRGTLYSMEEYSSILNNVITIMSRDNKVFITTRPIEDMYDSYRLLVSYYKDAGGFCNLRKFNSYFNLQETVEFIPPEGTDRLVDFETYCVSCNRLLYNIQLDFMTAVYMYDRYIYRNGILGPVSSSVLTLGSSSLKQLTNTIDSMLGGLDGATVLNILKGYGVDAILRDYYIRMLSSYNVDPAMSRNLLTYSSAILPYTSKGAKNKLGNVANEESIIVYPEYSNTVLNGIGGPTNSHRSMSIY